VAAGVVVNRAAVARHVIHPVATRPVVSRNAKNRQ